MKTEPGNELVSSAKAQTKGRKMKRFILCWLFLLVTVVQAGTSPTPLRPDDFAYGLQLKTIGHGAIYGFPVPSQVYEGCSRPDLVDMQIFSGRVVVPHLLRSQPVNRDVQPALALPFFPLFSGQESPRLPGNIHIATNEKGAIIDIRQEGQGQSSPLISAYILDISQLKRKADWLECSWQGQGEQFTTTVKIEKSNDLQHWQVVVSAAALARLNFGGHSLVRQRIVLPPIRSKYLRLSWPAGKMGITLTQVKAGYNGQVNLRPRQTRVLNPVKDEMDKKKKYRLFYYTSPGFFPVTSLFVRQQQHNSLAKVKIYSRADSKSPWQYRATMLSYQLVNDGVVLRSKAKGIRPTTDKYWRLEVVEGNPGKPGLEIGWAPQQCIFLAQGKGPYVAAYGRAGWAESPHLQVANLLATLDDQRQKKLIRSVQIGRQFILGGQGLLVPQPEFPWRRWLLWTSLFLGVVIIAAMVINLVRQMKSGNNTSD